MRRLSILVALVVLAVASAAAQSKKSAVPRTADGHPDLQGLWDFAQLTPLERPGEFAGKEQITEEEAEQFAQKRIETTHKDKRDGGAAADVERAYNDFWWDFGTRIHKQPSLVVDPPDGRIPAQTKEAQDRIAARRNRYDDIEDRPLAERCILGFNSGPPMVPSAYNNNVQIVQTPGFVVLLLEMNHDARIVAMDGRPHLSGSLRGWLGDSRGRWEGNTLVIETTNFTPKMASFSARRGAGGTEYGSGENLRLVERFTRVDAKTLQYEFTVNDPATFTGPFSGRMPMNWSDEHIYEYACHEGNYGLQHILRGARAADQRGQTK